MSTPNCMTSWVQPYLGHGLLPTVNRSKSHWHTEESAGARWALAPHMSTPETVCGVLQPRPSDRGHCNIARNSPPPHIVLRTHTGQPPPPEHSHRATLRRLRSKSGAMGEPTSMAPPPYRVEAQHAWSRSSKMKLRRSRRQLSARCGTAGMPPSVHVSWRCRRERPLTVRLRHRTYSQTEGGQVWCDMRLPPALVQNPDARRP